METDPASEPDTGTRAALWRVTLAFVVGADQSPTVTWEGYALSSTDANGQALAWAHGQAERVAPGMAKVRVLEVLQVGV